MTPLEYEYLCRFLQERSGLVLTADKTYLVESRLAPVARQHGLSGPGQIAQRLRAGAVTLEQDVIEAMTTNETFFFRDKLPFEAFAETMLPELMRLRSASRRLRIWCAASSTGQEPYSLAMMLKERAAALSGWSVEIIATDLSSDILARAKAGRFSQFEVQRGLPVALLVKYFKPVGEQWEIARDVRAMVQFRSLNLLRDFSPLGTFDVVFCRNVLIYFEEKTKADILRRVSSQLAPDGFLVLGAAETVVGLTTTFRPHPERRGVYLQAERSAVPALPRLAVAQAG